MKLGLCVQSFVFVRITGKYKKNLTSFIKHVRPMTPVPAEAASVGDELRCSSGVLVVKVRAHHPAPPSTALVEGGGAD